MLFVQFVLHVLHKFVNRVNGPIF